jgi:HAD superfamily hydrolase (TIGR01484 family)
MTADFNLSGDGNVPRVLATDLDGTLIPLPGNAANQEALQELRRCRDRRGFALIFATGRHYESVRAAMRAHELPIPDWIVCDVGTGVYRAVGGDFARVEAYEAHLAEIAGGISRDAVARRLADLDGLALQAPENQQRFKISYECPAELLSALVVAANEGLEAGELPFACTGSIDPFLDCGLLDVLPRGVSKAHALHWLAAHAGFAPDAVVYAGDSGNDLAALTSGFRAIVVANGSRGLAEDVAAALREQALHHRLYVAETEATSGVLEGCRHFGLIEREAGGE